MDSSDGSESGHVSPITSCPHVQAFLKVTEKVDARAPCSECKDVTENWLCLTCFSVGCCRFKGAHALHHFTTTKHPIAMSFSDLSTWCYECESYIRNPNLSRVFQQVHLDKFKAAPGASTYTISTGGMNEEELKEYFDEPQIVQEKVKILADLIRNSKHVVAYTGAGVSTSAKIPDYRGPKGVWTLQEKGLPTYCEVTLEQAFPTKTHMSLVQLHKLDVLKFLISTNVDGLHRRSGFPEKAISELHGNCYLESCSKNDCGKEYLRNFDASSHSSNHITGRKCDQCGTHLKDSIINFGEDLPTKELEKAVFQSGLSDLSLVLGTSMRVSPANKFPLQAIENGGKMVIVNLQKTPYDKKAFLVIHEKTDLVIELLMKELGIGNTRI